jgi:hypothetical protein
MRQFRGTQRGPWPRFFFVCGARPGEGSETVRGYCQPVIALDRAAAGLQWSVRSGYAQLVAQQFQQRILQCGWLWLPARIRRDLQRRAQLGVGRFLCGPGGRQWEGLCS